MPSFLIHRKVLCEPVSPGKNCTHAMKTYQRARLRRQVCLSAEKSLVFFCPLRPSRAENLFGGRGSILNTLNRVHRVAL